MQSIMEQSSSSFWSGGEVELFGGTDAEDLRTQLYNIECNLRDLDKRWRDSEQQRLEGKASQEDLHSRLQVSEENHRVAVQEKEQRLKAYKNEYEKLRKDLAVSEAESRSLRDQLNERSSQVAMANLGPERGLSEAKCIAGGQTLLTGLQFISHNVLEYLA